jgi:hypothetical protein
VVLWTWGNRIGQHSPDLLPVDSFWRGKTWVFPRRPGSLTISKIFLFVNAVMLPSTVILSFKNENDFKIKNKPHSGISKTYYVSNKTIGSLPQSPETVPLKELW